MPFLGIPTSRKDLGNAGWVKGAATTGARTIANAAQALPGSTPPATQNLRNFADAVDDPNRGYSGTLNPLTFVNSRAGAGNRSFSYGAPGAAGGEVMGSNTQNPGFDAYGNPLGGGGAYGAGGGEPYDPNTDPAKVAAKRQEVRSLMSAFEHAFNDVVGKVDTLATARRGEIETNYGEQQQGLDKNFGAAAGGIDDQYSARNTFQSSYRDNAQQQARDAYEGATAQMGRAKENDFAGLGRFAEEQKAELAGGRPNFNVEDYGEVDDLLSIQQDVQNAIGRLNTTGAGLGTNSQYRAKLNSIAPTQEQGSSQLKGMLDKLAMTGQTNPDAKRAIAMSTIAKTGGDQSAWMDYFEKQMNQTGSNAVAEPTIALS